MSLVAKIRKMLGLEQQAEVLKQQAEATAMLLNAVKELREEKKTAQKAAAVLPTEAAVPTNTPDSDASAALIKELQKQVDSLQKQLISAKEEGIKTLFADFKKNQEDNKEKQQKAGRPRIDGKNINLRIDIDTYNMLQFLASRKVLQKTRYINEKLREGLMTDIEADPLFSSLYKEYSKTDKIEDYE